MALPIGGFMPIPLAMMIPFMATQSMVMGDAFGRAFQYGKRKISAMSNEEFNATSLEQQASEMFSAYKIIIGENHLRDAIKESQELQKVIIDEMLLILPKFLSQTGTDLFGKTDIKTEIEDHPHTSTRPHTHSDAPPTVTGTTTSNGITTTHYSDGTSTTSGTETFTSEIIKSYNLTNAELKALSPILATRQITIKIIETSTTQYYTKTLSQWQTELKRVRQFAGTSSNPDRIMKNLIEMQRVLNSLTQSFN